MGYRSREKGGNSWNFLKEDTMKRKNMGRFFKEELVGAMTFRQEHKLRSGK